MTIVRHGTGSLLTGMVGAIVIVGYSGKVRTVVGGNWNGIDYMRSKESGRSDAKSNSQLNQRSARESFRGL